MQLTTWNFSRSQKRMVLQRQPGCAGEPEPWLHTGLLSPYTPHTLRALKSNALGQGWPWTGRGRGHSGRPAWALDLDMPLKAQDTGREPNSPLGLAVIQSMEAIRHMTPWDRDTDWGQIYIHSGRAVRSSSHRRRACFSSSPVRAARSQEVLVGVKLHHVDGPRVARELGHHLAGSQVPELGRGRWRSGPGRAPRPPALPPVQPKLCPHSTFLPICTAWDSNPKEGGGDQPECDPQMPGPSPGPGSGQELPSLCGHLQPMPTTSRRG